MSQTPTGPMELFELTVIDQRDRYIETMVHHLDLTSSDLRLELASLLIEAVERRGRPARDAWQYTLKVKRVGGRTVYDRYAVSGADILAVQELHRAIQ